MNKKCASNKSFVLPALISAAGLALTAQLSAQTFSTLYSFDGTDGANPNAGLLFSGTTMFGTTQGGGSVGHGTVFALNFDGTGFTNLYNFTGGLDGDSPAGSLILSGNTLYGTTTAGGSWGSGTVFGLHTDGSGFTNLHSFTALNNSTNGDGASPRAGLILSGNTLFGTAEFGGGFGAGTVFALHTDGTGFSNLHTFAATSGSSYTNGDGAYPFAGLALSSNILYGNTYQGGSSGNGTVFVLHTDGTGFAVLHMFTEGAGSWPTIVNSDGANPPGALIVSSNRLFGATYTGGGGGAGTVFAIGLDGNGLTTLHHFTPIGYSGSIGNFTNQDGASPVDGLTISGNTLYGSTFTAGVLGAGTIFAVGTNGADFTVLHTLNMVNDGTQPLGGLVLSGNTLFGTASAGGSGGMGTVFSLTLLPQLTIARSGVDVVLMWPTSVAGFDFSSFTLQTTTNLTSPIWTTNLPAPIVVNGLNTVTNPISASQQFFRLSR